MPPIQSKNSFQRGMNLDLDQLRLPPDVATWIKDATININTNAGTGAKAGSNQNVLTPIEGNQALSVSNPSGTNYQIGFYSSEQTNEGYYFLQNMTTPTNSSIWVISGDTGSVRKVFQGLYTTAPFDPKYFYSEGRVTMELVSFFNKVTGLQDYYKLLCFTNNFNEPRCIEVESSIATTSFSTSYFTTSGANFITDTLITLGVPLPIKCIGINTPNVYSPTTADKTIQNAEVRRVWQFRVKNIDIFGRESEHGIITNQYTPIVSGGCIASSASFPRCVSLNFDAGNPLVNFIQVEYRVWVDGQTPFETNWYLYDTISKYDNSTNVAWYSRNINPALTYNATTNVITYDFCADKESQPLDVNETLRTEPEVPRMSGSIFAIMKRLGLANNVRGFQPISQTQLSKITVSAVDAASSPCTAATMRKVIVYANIYNPFGKHSALMRTSYGQVVFGDSDNGVGCMAPGTTPPHTSSFTLDQVFADQQNPGFIGYMAGMSGAEFSAIGVQGDFELATGIFTPLGYGPGLSFSHEKMIQFEFMVPEGSYIMRISSHKSKLSDGNFQSTSTYTAGQCPIFELSVTAGRDNYAQNPIKEISINAFGGNVILNGGNDPMFVILDLGNGVDSGGLDGYLYESPGGPPVEMSPIWLAQWGPGGGDTFGSFFTDHNGFYFCASDAAPKIKILADICDGTGVQTIKTILGNRSSMWHGDGTGTATGVGTTTTGGGCGGVTGYWYNRMYVTKTAFPECARQRSKQNIFLCGTATGVPGVLGVISSGAVGLTDANGLMEIISHNRYDYLTAIGSDPPPHLASLVPSFPSSAIYDLFLSFNQNGACNWTTCGNCGRGLGIPSVPYIPCCTVCAPGCRTASFADLSVQIPTLNAIGCQSGGKYEVAIILHDELGRHTFAQKVGSVTTKRLNESGYQKFSLQSIAYAIGSSFAVPTYFKYLTFAVSPNTLFNNFISWCVDWVQFVDNTGNENKANPTAIRIYYSSLIEYNKQFNFNTNTNWQFIPENANNPEGVPQEGDELQFIVNADGITWLPAEISLPVTYSADGKFITVDYDSRLSGLTNGALFRAIRPNQFNEKSEFTYYEQCFTIVLNSDGTVPTGKLTGTLPYFDSSIQNRQIPVPLLSGQFIPIPPGGAPLAAIQYTSTGNPNPGNGTGPLAGTNANNFNNVVIMSTITAQTIFPFYFESFSLSDFWGYRVANDGRIFTTNPYEQERRIGTEIAVSAAVNDRGTFNGMAYFESINSKVFDKNVFGNISSVLVEMGMCLVICNSDWFITRFGQSQLQTNDDGTVSAQKTEGLFTAPQLKVGENYGCIAANINTIRKYNGLVYWLDAKGRFIRHNFTNAVNVAEENRELGITGGYSGYLLNKISSVATRNLTPNTNGSSYWIGGIDPKTHEVYLTAFNIPASGSPSYLNTLSAISMNANETLVIDLHSGTLKGMSSMTPEGYGLIPGYYLQKQFLTFKNGVPYIQHAGLGTSTLYANYFGTQCFPRITHVTNLGPEKVKRYLWMEVYVKETMVVVGGLYTALFLADVITTEKIQSSRLLTSRWRVVDGYSTAEFLCDLNTPADPNIPVQTGAHVLLDGNPLIGRWLSCSLVVQSSYAGTYFELSGVNTYVNGIEPSDRK